MIVGGISVVALDDHAVFVDALVSRLSAESDLRPVRATYTAEQCLRAVQRGAVDVAVLDHRVGETTGAELTEAIRSSSPGTRVVMLSAVRSTDAVLDCLVAGARAWLSKEVEITQLVRVIRGVHAGEAWVDPAVLGEVLPRLVERAVSPEPDPLGVLTQRERQVLDRMVDGLSRSEIAHALGLSTNTVRTHTQNLMAKLGAHSSLEAVTIALRLRHRPMPH